MATGHPYRELAEAAWRWVLDQVRHDEGGPWIPTTPSDTEPGWDRDGMHSGVGGLAHALAEVSATRPWTDEESALAAAIGERLRSVTPTAKDITYFDGLVSHLQCLVLLGEPGVDACVDRLLELAPDGWPDMNDATLGTAAIVLGGLTAIEAGCARGAELAAYAADRLLAEAEETPAGLNWLFVPRRHVPPDKLDDGRPVEMPNWSHGLAGIAAALARAGSVLERPDLVDAARQGAEHLVTLADPASLADGGLALPRRIPHKPDHDEYTWNWCHGPAGTWRCSRRSTRPVSPTWPASRRQRGWHGACTRCTRRASPSAAGRASGTTTAAVAAPPVSALPCYLTTRPSR